MSGLMSGLGSRIATKGPYQRCLLGPLPSAKEARVWAAFDGVEPGGATCSSARGGASLEMTTQGESRIAPLFHQLVEQTPDARRLRPEAVAAEDAALADQLRRLLEAAAAEPIERELEAALNVLFEEPAVADGSLVAL
jgi:hypothetical protein